MIEESNALLPVKIVEGQWWFWFSICSRHMIPNPNCKTCQIGGWQRVKITPIEEDEKT